jgi:ribosomal protein S18 acetylase RimI-like enzyme
MSHNNIVEEYTAQEAKLKDIDDIIKFRLRIQEYMERKNNDIWHLSESKKKGLKDFYFKQLSNHESILVVVKLKQDYSNVAMGLGRIFRNDDYVPSVYGRIDDVWVEPEHRRKGLCKLIVFQLIQFFQLNAIDRLVLNYVIGNIEADTVWPHIGFKPVLITANRIMSK